MNTPGIKQKITHHRTLIENFSFLSVLQLFNVLLPLIVYPYLIRVLGADLYGLIVYAQAIIGYFVILVNFGFNDSATKEISICRENKQKLNEIVSSVLILKGILFILSMIALSILILFIPGIRDQKVLFYLTMWMCFYEFAFPIWYFQGIEKMKYITIVNLISRFSFLVLIFFFVRHSDDYLNIPILNGIGALIAGSISLYIVFHKQKIRFSFQPIQILLFYARNSLHYFASSISIQVYLKMNKVIVGSFLGMQELAYYDLGDKILGLLKMPVSILSQTLFPRMSKEYNSSFLKKIYSRVTIAYIILIILFEIFASQIAVIVGGIEMLPSVVVIRILILSLIPLVVSNAMGVQSILALGFKKDFSKVVAISALLYFCIFLLLWGTNFINLYSISLIQLVIEIYMLIHFYLICRKHKIFII